MCYLNGMYLEFSTNNNITGNNITCYVGGNYDIFGIYLAVSDYNRITRNFVANTYIGIFPTPRLGNNSISNNTFFNNTINAYIDSDNDGYEDEVDTFPNDPTEWYDTDYDGIGDNADDDDDGDGYNDTLENEFETDPLNASSHPDDFDSDFIPDEHDDDDDNDGVLDEEDLFPLDSKDWADIDGDGIGDNADPDDNNNYIPDVAEIPLAVILILFPMILLFIYNKRAKRKKESSEDSSISFKIDEDSTSPNEEKNE